MREEGGGGPRAIPLTETVGAEVVGAGLHDLLEAPDFPTWCLSTLEAHGVLVFRGLHLDDASQTAFSRRLGKVEVFGQGEFPEIFRVTLDPEKNPAAPYLRGTFDWHIDGLTDDVPIMATLLCAHEVSTDGGETEFASSYEAFESLTGEEKERCLGLRVVHSLEASQRRIQPNPSDAELAMWRSRPEKEHPLVWRHRSGRRSLVLGATASHVVGMEEGESRALLDGLLDHSTAPGRVYRHRWTVGDLVLWDNRGVLHRALPYDASSGRDMHRTTLHGDEAIQ